ncbi:MAG: hypothetical protein NZL90_00180 [Aquificaceae bacterium]|nr:hypothetical protein [Aquificaceae bacterium]MDW8236816.1 hypothetical protein [Aquificaceae bacterium]
MKPFGELSRFRSWAQRFKEEFSPPDAQRFEKALEAMRFGGRKERLLDERVYYWTNFCAEYTYRLFNSFKDLNDNELCFVFYALGKLLVPLFLHERGVCSEAFSKLSKDEQEKAVLEELNSLLENQIIGILQSLPYLNLNSSKNPP